MHKQKVAVVTDAARGIGKAAAGIEMPINITILKRIARE